MLGINDINDEVVAETLKALAILVQALGAAKVIGSKNRKKIFSDGSPSKCGMKWLFDVFLTKQVYNLYKTFINTKSIFSSFQRRHGIPYFIKDEFDEVHE